MFMPTADISSEVGGATTVSIDVEIIYAQADSIWRQRLTLPAPSAVRDALVQSQFFTNFPDSSIDTVQVGIYGQKCTMDRQLITNDRIEIYRPLVFDPMESRRRRARHRQRMKEPGKMPRI